MHSHGQIQDLHTKYRWEIKTAMSICSRPFSWLEIDAVYKLGNYTLVRTTLYSQSDDLAKQPITVTGLAIIINVDLR